MNHGSLGSAPPPKKNVMPRLSLLTLTWAKTNTQHSVRLYDLWTDAPFSVAVVWLGLGKKVIGLGLERD